MMKLSESPSKQAFMILLLNWEINQQQVENHKQIRKRRFMSRRHNQGGDSRPDDTVNQEHFESLIIIIADIWFFLKTVAALHLVKRI
jgi:hypothetical protein